MYSTCLFCNRPLGGNETIEHFPIGRRLAFDAAHGRLWVVCLSCERWNLTPLEERWEAIEECERRYRDSRKRVATDHVGLARVDDGLDLVRIGEPLRPEFAAWRYGDQFGRRRWRQLARAGLGLSALGVVVVGGVGSSIGLGGLWAVYKGAELAVKGRPDTVVARIPTQESLLRVRRRDLNGARFTGASRGHSATRWSIRVDHAKGLVNLAGAEARTAAQLLLPAINRFGASRDLVAGAVSEIEREGDASQFFTNVAQNRKLPIAEMTPTLRLGLEMALHEDDERRALEGELAALEDRWREAEEVAAIADNLLLPAGIDERIRAFARGLRRGG